MTPKSQLDVEVVFRSIEGFRKWSEYRACTKVNGATIVGPLRSTEKSAVDSLHRIIVALWWPRPDFAKGGYIEVLK